MSIFRNHETLRQGLATFLQSVHLQIFIYLFSFTEDVNILASEMKNSI